jgi:class 3 adenylate cyclase
VKTAQDIISEVKAIFATTWATRKGIKVPEPESVTLGNDAVTIDGTVLYADMADSTGLVNGFKDWYAAEIYKCYLVAASHLIRNNSGTITAFDGDRVMAVYHGDQRNPSAVKTALQINWAVREINAAAKLKYPNSSYQLKHSVGIDSGGLFVAKTGIRLSNDLVWVGRAANYAAKLCTIVDHACITESVFDNLSDNTKFGGSPRRSMWEKFHWSAANIPVYKSNWIWTP